LQAARPHKGARVFLRVFGFGRPATRVRVWVFCNTKIRDPRAGLGLLKYQDPRPGPAPAPV
jgi:hypothetical protein